MLKLAEQWRSNNAEMRLAAEETACLVGSILDGGRGQTALNRAGRCSKLSRIARKLRNAESLPRRNEHSSVEKGL